MADEKKTDANQTGTADAEARAAARDEAHAALDERLDREEALAAVPQKVIDPNEAAALETITGQKPIRDMSDAPAPGQLGPHMESVNPVDDPADVNTSVAGVEGDEPKKAKSK